MPRRRNKLRNIAEISCLDGSSVRRLCSSSVPERREAAIQEVVRRAAAWDSQCQEYARRLRRQCPDVVLRCSETAPDPSLPVCREFRLPPDVGAGVLAATDQKSSESRRRQMTSTSFCRRAWVSSAREIFTTLRYLRRRVSHRH